MWSLAAGATRTLNDLELNAQRRLSDTAWMRSSFECCGRSRTISPTQPLPVAQAAKQHHRDNSSGDPESMPTVR